MLFRLRSAIAVSCAVAGCIALSLIPAQAQTAALDFTGGDPTNFVGSGVGGWTFSITSSSVTIDALGVWDEYADGLFESHMVGLWDQTGSLIAFTTVSNDNSAPLASTSSDGQWLFTDIVPLSLGPGDYTIGMQALNDSPDPFRIITTSTTVSGITYGTSVHVTETIDFERPTEVVFEANDGGFGPNLRVVIPESSTVALALTALGMVGAVFASKHTVVFKRGKK